MDFKEAFKIMFDFNIWCFEEAFENSCMCNLFKSLKDAKKMKTAVECLKEKFGWEENFIIYKHNGFYYVAVDEGFTPFEKIE